MSGEWVVRDTESGNTKAFESRGDAEAAVEEMAGLGVDAEVVPPGSTQTAEPVPADHDAPELDAREAELAERTVSEDPLNWMPADFVDEIEGSPAINRRGFEVLGHFYDVDVQSQLEVAPEDTDFEYCRVKATATTPDGRLCEAYGSAHVNRENGDDPTLLLELADTRARKRALSVATGVGAVAVEELRSELDE